MHLAGLPRMESRFVVLDVVSKDGQEQATRLVQPPQACGPHFGAFPAAESIDLEHVAGDQQGVDGEAQGDFHHGQDASRVPDLGDFLHHVKGDGFVFDLFHGVPGVHGAHAWVGQLQHFFALEEAVRHDGGHVFGRGGAGQGVLLGHVLADDVELDLVLDALEHVHINALLFEAVVELVVHHAVLGFLADEVLDVLRQLGVCDLVLEVPHAVDEELLALGEDGRHGVEKTCLEDVAAEPVFGDVAVQTEVEVLPRDDVLRGAH